LFQVPFTAGSHEFSAGGTPPWEVFEQSI